MSNEQPVNPQRSHLSAWHVLAAVGVASIAFLGASIWFKSSPSRDTSPESGRAVPEPQAVKAIPEQPLDPLPLPTRSDGWSAEDLENAAHYVSAVRAADAAWSLCNNSGHSGRPWLMTERDRQQFARLMDRANREARLVRSDLLRRMHAALPDAFADFVNSTYYIGPNVIARRPDDRVKATWRRWVQWRQTHGDEIRVPKGAAPQRSQINPYLPKSNPPAQARTGSDSTPNGGQSPRFTRGSAGRPLVVSSAPAGLPAAEAQAGRDVDIPFSMRVRNAGDPRRPTTGNCAWCALETICLHAGYRQAANASKGRAGASFQDMRNYLASTGVPHRFTMPQPDPLKPIPRRDFGFISAAIKANRGVWVSLDRRATSLDETGVPGHALVIVGIDSNWFRVIDNADPTLQVRTRPITELYRLWTGHALYIEGR